MIFHKLFRRCDFQVVKSEWVNAQMGRFRFIASGVLQIGKCSICGEERARILTASRFFSVNLDYAKAYFGYFNEDNKQPPKKIETKTDLSGDKNSLEMKVIQAAEKNKK